MRVRTTMEAQAKIEGRFLGGRPPHGYPLQDVGPTPIRARQPMASGCTAWSLIR